ncbi:MAG TPA: YkvA family protein [Vicinamibacteria bacterium]|nr:YkvA family protein [Vicinamibacteria bacterium]
MSRLLARLRRAAALLSDPRVKKLPRFAVLAALAYLIWPADLVPDFLVPIAGYLDDATLLWLSMRWLFRSGPPDEREIPPQAEPR